MKNFVRAAIAAASLSVSGAALADGTVYATYTGSQQGVTERASATLAQSFAFNTGADGTGVAAANGHVYFSAANHLYDYTTGGALVTNMTFPDPAILYTGVAVDAGTVYASYQGSQQGVTIRDLNLNQISSFGTGINASGIAVGDGNIFLSAANHLYRYTTAGALLVDFAFPDSGIEYTGISYANSTVFASYKGTQQGFTIRDLNLGQLNFVSVGFDISDIVAGDNNNVFLTSANNIYEYGLNGLLLNTMTFPDAGINYSAIAFVPNAPAVPEPTTWAMMIGGLGLVGAAMRRRVTAVSFA